MAPISKSARTPAVRLGTSVPGRPWWWRWLQVIPAAVLAGTAAAGCYSSPSGHAGGGSYTVRNYGARGGAATGASEQPTLESASIHAPGVIHDSRFVRVHILNGKEAFDLSIDAEVEVLDNSLQPVETLDRIRPQPVALTGASLAIGNRIYYGVDRLELRLKTPGRCQIDDEDLGTGVKVLTIFRNQGERKLHCVVSWTVEDYLYGVLAGEVPVEWPAEALKAQAVASRTYVLYQMQDRRYEEFDVERTVNSQVFKTGDAKKIDARFTAAVDATRGEFLTCGGTVFPAYFHSTCGGESASSADVFGGDPIAALGGHRHETFCAASSVYRWTRTIPLSEFELRLAKKKLWDSSGGNSILNILPVGSAAPA
ncbi:MAG TPA: SpoIID/LytB domain-containing protein, partial [Planctomycetota bacterium]|nr:SpoIID/LytB domain-containing protein [Planctomycetota bacterium]